MPNNPDSSKPPDAFQFPPAVDQRMQHLMHRNNEGLLTDDEREELESLVMTSESMSLLSEVVWRRFGGREG